MTQQYLSWNRLPKVQALKYLPLNIPAIPKNVNYPILVQGNRRSYSDVCLNEQGDILLATSLDKFIAFDRNTGQLTAQAGVLLTEILKLVVPQGWFLSVTPGTSLVTLGGAIANDVHGKNHHIAGSFGHHVLSLTLQRSTGEYIECSLAQNQELFRATIGGLGLTGLICQATIQLQAIHNPMMFCENHSFANLDEYWQLNSIMQPLWSCSASWIDCLAHGKTLGRGVMFLGKHAATLPENQMRLQAPKNLNVPVEFPFSLVNPMSLWGFNQLYFLKNKAEKQYYSHYRPYFYPLDSIQNWNRIYGHKGFYQYQCVLPPETERDGIQEILNQIQKTGQGSFLAVLKSFGNIPSLGMLSFPRQGTTLALDFPNKGQTTLDLLSRLDNIVLACKGALYPAKDARMSKQLFESGYTQLEQFVPHIDEKFSSHFWQRLFHE